MVGWDGEGTGWGFQATRLFVPAPMPKRVKAGGCAAGLQVGKGEGSSYGKLHKLWRAAQIERRKLLWRNQGQMFSCTRRIWNR